MDARFAITMFGFVVVFAAGSAFAQPTAEPPYASVIAALPDRVAAGMKSENIPGLAVAIVDGDQIIWSRGFGVTDVSAPQPVTDATLFSIQSISKTYTTIGFLRARERWGIKLDETLVKYYPGFMMQSRYGKDELRKITFRQLLSHWAGLPHEAPLGGNFDERYCTFEEHIASLERSWMKAPVGSRYSYSNVGVDLVGYALQRLSRMPFPEYMKRDVFTPLGMQNSTFRFELATNSANFARGHIEGKPAPIERIPMMPSGGMYSTASDLARFIVYALHAGERTVTEMARIQYPVPAQTTGYGLGLEIGEIDGIRVLRHGGGGYGYTTTQTWVPQYKVGVVVLANAGDVGFSDTLANEVLASMIALRHSGRVTRAAPPVPPPVQHALPSLRDIEGTYKTYGRVVTVARDGDRLVLRRGNNNGVGLTRTGSRTFVTESGETLTFSFDRKGQVSTVLAVGDHGVDTWFLNDRKDEPARALPAGWRAHIGAYRMGAYGQEFTTNIYEQNGSLYSSRSGGTRLVPFRANLFFTPDGESVEFIDDDKMILGNRPAIKITPAQDSSACADYPAAAWSSWSTPEEAGWNAEGLTDARDFAQSIGSVAGMVVVGGKVLVEWGETARKFNVHSIRKSLLSALYGTAVAKGEIGLSSTLAQLGVDDTPPSLTAEEKKATVADLLQATSGVFHPALYETADMIASKPPRGSHPPGAYWLYSNWDFNALGTIFERAAYSTIFKEFKHRIAEPLRMQDYETSDGAYVDGPESIHPAYPFRLTARDMARFGLLYARNGSWCGQQVISAEWVKESTTAHHVTAYKPGVGYGYLWWVGVSGTVFPGVVIDQSAYYAWGTGGHYIFLVPTLDLVIVNRVNTDAPGKRMSDEEFGAIVVKILGAQEH